MKIHLSSNGGTIDLSKATTEQQEGITSWYVRSQPYDVLTIEYSGKSYHVQKVHVVFIEQGR